MNNTVLEVRHLKAYFATRHGVVRAADDVSFALRKGETLCLVGESGCGKTAVALSILRLLDCPPGKIAGGEIIYDGEDLLGCSSDRLRQVRGNRIAMIFQDPQSSLDPRMTIGDSIGEALLIHGVRNERERLERVTELLKQVGLEPEHAGRYPHEFSGGQKQRIGIARALAVNPKLIIADEPVSALDVSVQAQILNLLMDLQRGLGLAFLFIAHDLSVISHVSDRIAVMYLGKVVELAHRAELLGQPLHPYTEALLSAVPVPDPSQKRKRIILPGEVPSPTRPPAGCRFHPRCSRATKLCIEEEPVLEVVAEGHSVACHRWRK